MPYLDAEARFQLAVSSLSGVHEIAPTREMTATDRERRESEIRIESALLNIADGLRLLALGLQHAHPATRYRRGPAGLSDE